MNKTSIEWTHRPETGGAAGGFTWNPIRARRIDGLPESALADGSRTGTFCTHISPGCVNCYAEAIGKRFGTGLAFNVPNLAKIEFFIDEKILEEPLRRKKPATIFVGDMFDLFHEAIPEHYIGHVFGVMALAKQHTFQVLTKRAKELQDCIAHAEERYGPWGDEQTADWPLPNVWLGVSVESQQYADERIPLLLQTPAAVRFLSVEPMLEAVNVTYLSTKHAKYLDSLRGIYVRENWQENSCTSGAPISWVICGGESGPGARPFNLAWAESLQKQCKAAGVAFFMKQVGSKPLIPKSMELTARGEFLTETTCHDPAPLIVTSKGGDMSEWPESLRVREFPAERLVTA